MAIPTQIPWLLQCRSPGYSSSYSKAERDQLKDIIFFCWRFGFQLLRILIDLFDFIILQVHPTPNEILYIFTGRAELRQAAESCTVRVWGLSRHIHVSAVRILNVVLHQAQAMLAVLLSQGIVWILQLLLQPQQAKTMNITFLVSENLCRMQLLGMCNLFHSFWKIH